ncbi:VOC family protein [Nesterenkonia alkaliphila]|uniref:Glyoxalase/fosfomycin resistance/dioxygenase domain-containing protein n=1 Tax=Nesterenkonia alkaliphila TaxID=1463631 RepID=A0A7K1UGR1_9MICC|nr:VOC family protein [Nesterenkonia alkaliphila]MVT25660.1 hypothetical protein [Nesterenkonia alkaliphila]GFZ84942.1 hypothetical protein GCM10011359_12440 [Nesterenkonia alkaliphila]
MTTPPTTGLPALTVQPVQFSSDYARWREFYLKLGLRPTEAVDPMVTVLTADSGQLMLGEVPVGHPLDGIRVQLAHRRQESIAVDLPQGRPVVQVLGETGDVLGLAAELEDRGLQATVIDESYGRSLRVLQPNGRQLYINETMHDLYGYHRLDD